MLALEGGFMVTRLAVLVAALWLGGSVASARVVAVGDLHGDFAAWRAIAVDAGLIDAKGRWRGGTTTFVQVGDTVDRGPDSLKIVEDLMRLQREAAKAHGRVIALVGNHEAMNVTNDVRYVSAGDYAAFTDARSAATRDATYAANRAVIEADYRKRDPALTPEAIRAAWIAATPLGQLEHQAAWQPNGRIGKWVAGNPAVALVEGTLFVHGGIAPAYAQVPLAELNTRVAAALKAGDIDPASIINDEAGPLWYRGLAAPAAPAVAGQPTVAAQLDTLLPAFGAQRIVIAHTPNLTGIVITEGGRLARIDTGISAVYKGVPSWLEIADGKFTAHVVARPTAGGAK